MRNAYKIIALSLWIAVCLLLFHIFYQNAKETAIADLNARQTIHGKQAAKGIEGFFDHWITLLTSTSKRNSIIDLDDEGKKQMEFVLRNHEEGIRGITRVDQAGRILYTLPYDAKLIGADISNQSHVQAIMRTHRPVLSGVFTAVQGFRAVALHVPVFRGTEYRGTLAVLLDFGVISKRFLEDIIIGKTGYAWMIDRDGIELYCPVPGHTGKSVFDNCRDFPTILAMAQEMVKGRQGTTTYFFDWIRGKESTTVRKHAVYLPVRIADSFWSIVVATAEDDVIASLQGFRNRLLGVIVILLIGSVLFSYYAMKSWGIIREEQKRRKAEKELVESEERFRTLYDEAPVGYHELDAQGRIVRINKRELAMLGYADEEMMGQPAWRFIVDEEAEGIVKAKLTGTMPPNTGADRTYRRKDGTTVAVLIDDVIVRDKEGRITGIRSTIQDITERKRAEEALKEREAFIKAVLDNLPIGVAVNSLNPTVAEYMNDNFPRFYRTTRERLAEPDAFWTAVYEDPVFREKMKKRVLDDCASGDPARMSWVDVPLTRQGGETAFITARNIPIPERQLMISTVWDVTERKREEVEKEKLRAQLQQVQKMESVGRLAGGVAHDFNNILGIIIGNAETAVGLIGPDEPIHKNLREILDASHRSADIIRQLLAFARKQTIDPKALNLNDTIQGMLQMLSRLIGEDIKIRWIPGKNLWSVRMDATQIHQILANLVVNSRDAIDGVGTVTLETDNVVFDESYCRGHEGAVPGEYVLLAVSDTGSGISPEILGQLFDPFFTTKELGRGTGLGLATVYGIVKQNNGFISVSSEPGQGTTFKIHVPRHIVEVEHEREATAVKKSLTGSETILVVEDEAALLEISRINLARMGYTVLTARTPREAIVLAETHPGEIHLLLTDVVMPEMNGRELMERLRSIRPSMKSIFMSGYTSDVIAHRGVLDEGISFLQKPFTRTTLAAKVRESLDRS